MVSVRSKQARQSLEEVAPSPTQVRSSLFLAFNNVQIIATLLSPPTTKCSVSLTLSRKH
jgi:hypothetical protein